MTMFCFIFKLRTLRFSLRRPRVADRLEALVRFPSCPCCPDACEELLLDFLEWFVIAVFEISERLPKSECLHAAKWCADQPKGVEIAIATVESEDTNWK